MRAENLVELLHITKNFPGVVALDDVSFTIKKGEIHCLCGENGAGKSTLINICGGVYQPDSGQILFDGRTKRLLSPLHAEELGIGVAYQEIPLCKNMTVAANIFLGPKLKLSKGLLDWHAMEEETRELLALFNMKNDPGELVENLSIAEQSLIQIARVIYRKPRLLILDEPTAALTIDQKDTLFSLLKHLRQKQELSILYVSHRLEEVFEIADRITVLRDGKYIGTLEAKETDADNIIKMMVGREIKKTVARGKDVKAKKILEVKHLSRKGTFHDITFDLYEGEILGFAGFQGAGRTEVMRAIFGLDGFDAGEIYIDGRIKKIKSPIDAIKNRIGMISENRRDEGIVPLMTVKDNLIIVALDETSTIGFLQAGRIRELFKEFVARLNIKVASPFQLITKLSGGNQQKVIIARWLVKKPRILICDEPTRGIDVGAKAEIHSILDELTREGIGIILISSELPELLAICDRIVVMHEGTITGELNKKDATEEKIMRLAAGMEV
ncbi:sugar ABC transporter ATP-binding protein [Neomoorella thermoacetica]|uniref:sugar ABC transporter ATP-binding protein n=1 Tax=Neomoorella thermoacetica TaxID=1525 RepID=UPI0008FB146D|nr:sugar ABC transporter ATP-binding protein [Moorella thermoacetica]OIQ62627.1 ribose import ATP-binding protein RbsA [Moorella thermoacetica]